MTFISIAIASFLFQGLMSAPAMSAVTDEAYGTVDYEVNYNLAGITTKVADAAISLERALRDGQPVLHAHAAIKASAVFQLFMNAEYIADSYLTPDRIEPVYYMNPIKKGRKTGKFECVYDKTGKTISSVFDKPSSKLISRSFPYDGLTMDLLSLIQFVRFHDMTAGDAVSLHLLMAGDSVAATLTCEGSDTARFPGKDLVRFHIKMIDRGLMENGSGDELTVWRSTSADRRVLGLETSLGKGIMTVSIKE